MNEETKAKVNHIVEMMSIYQASIDGADIENMRLAKAGLETQEQELMQIKKELDKKR